MKPPAIGATVDVPTLRLEADYDPATRKTWCGKQRGRVVELVESGQCRYRDDPLVCLEVAGEDGTLYAWFHASDIRAGALADPEFQLSVDAMVSEHRPRIPEDPCLPKDKYVLIFRPEEECWTPWKRYRGPLAD